MKLSGSRIDIQSLVLCIMMLASTIAIPVFYWMDSQKGQAFSAGFLLMTVIFISHDFFYNTMRDPVDSGKNEVIKNKKNEGFSNDR